MTKSIHEVAAEVLAKSKAPMTADEIFDAIVAQNLYAFKAQSPKSVLRSQLRRHSANVAGTNQAKELVFQLHDDGRYSLLK